MKLQLKFKPVFILFWISAFFSSIPALFMHEYKSLADWYTREVQDTYETKCIIHKLNNTPTVMQSTPRQLAAIIREQLSVIEDWIDKVIDADFQFKYMVLDTLQSAYAELDLIRFNIEKRNLKKITPAMRNNIRLTCKDALKTYAGYTPQHFQTPIQD